MVDRILHVIGRVSPVVSVALLVSAAVWMLLASLYAPDAQAAGWLLAAGLFAALFAIVVACYSAVRVLLRG